MPFWRLYYHVVWATKNRQPLLTAEFEPVVYDFLRVKAIGLEGTVFALNGISDHVHLVAAIPPKISIAVFIGQIKGVAATKFNKAGLSDVPLYWQEEYGVFSFDQKRLPNFVGYVERQKQHHADHRLIKILECTDEAGGRMVREEAGGYEVEDSEWWTEMAEVEVPGGGAREG